MDSALIVSSKEKSAASLLALLKTERLGSIGSVKSGAEARRCCAQRSFDLIIINAPLSDEFGDRLAADLLQKTDAGVMLIVSSELEGITESKTSKYGCLVVPKPLDRIMFYKALHFIDASRSRINGMRRENIKLQKKIEDIRIVNRAKYILMEYLSMSEPQAHKYLEKQAMDLRLTKLEVAKNLLSTYDG